MVWNEIVVICCNSGHCKIIETFIEDGYKNNAENDPYKFSSPQQILGKINNKHFHLE